MFTDYEDFVALYVNIYLGLNINYLTYIHIYSIQFFGEPGEIWTLDPMIKSHVLFQLSYRLICIKTQKRNELLESNQLHIV